MVKEEVSRKGDAIQQLEKTLGGVEEVLKSSICMEPL